MAIAKGLTRRRAVFGAAALAAATALAPALAAPASTPLKLLARRRGLYYGSAVQLTHLQKEPDLTAALTRECAAIVPEWEMKWGAMETRRGRPQYYRCDAFAEIARKHRLWLRGHAVLWHRNVPAWVEEVTTETPDFSVIEARTRGLMGRYGTDIIPEWDVLNEIIEPENGRPDGLRQSVFLDAFGFSYIKDTLQIAREVQPNARLYINEYGLDYDNCTARDRRRAMLRLVERLKAQGAPLDAIGIQAHLRPGGAPFSARSLRRFLADLAGLDVRIAITELDAREQDLSLPVEERDRIVADEVARYLDVVLDERAVIGLSTWGLSDRHSWLTSTAMRDEGLVNRGLPLDEGLAEKPMRHAMARALRQRRPA